MSIPWLYTSLAELLLGYLGGILLVGLAFSALRFWSVFSTDRAADRVLVLLADGRERSSLALREAIGSPVYAALEQLERRGYVTRRIGPKAAERGNRPRYFYSITDGGRVLLRDRDTGRARSEKRPP